MATRESITVPYQKMILPVLSKKNYWYGTSTVPTVIINFKGTGFLYVKVYVRA